ncbi:homoserine kinase [Staphylococcus epidermidis]|uniref:phosphotransferase enzyme family protein n=1 Tax=Staphylococcus epidermidis TaxID=1282 RepID=UPI000E004CDB|nr:phosphotransferase [Staphylococcus epidermidis]SUM53571.1 homoserine kinase [Staphylococcus epidermidis]
MDKKIKAIYDESAILKEAAKLYGFKLNNINIISEAENYVYEYSKNDQKYILKVTHTLRRSINYILGELEWINYLDSKGLNLSVPIRSLNGKYIEEIKCNNKSGCFLIRSYEKAPGKKVDKEDWNEKLFYHIGQHMGKMHRFTKEYKVSDLKYKRQEWYEEDQLNLNKYIPENQTIVLKKAEELMEKLKKLPTKKDDYGLVHADMHHGNFHLDNNEIITFDFDDIGYNWFINDISILLYNVLWYPAIPYNNKEEFVGNFLNSFLDGYFNENTLSKLWLDSIPDFLKLRQILIYGLLHQMLDLENLSKDEEIMLKEIRFDIENDVPITKYNFELLYNN